MADSEITSVQLLVEGIRVLCRELGHVNAARFIRQMSLGSGDSVEDRDRLLGSMTVDEIYAAIVQCRKTTDKNGKD